MTTIDKNASSNTSQDDDDVVSVDDNEFAVDDNDDDSGIKQSTRDDNNKDKDEDEMSDELKEYKLKLEAKTGKKYKYRTPKKQLPSVEYLLKFGTPGNEFRALSVKETIQTALIFGSIFVVSYLFFHFVFFSRESNREPFRLKSRGTFSKPMVGEL